MGIRIATFVMLGPFLVWLQYMILQVPDLILKPGAGSAAPFFGLVLVIVAMLGVVPGVALAVADHLMVQRGLTGVLRAAICGVLGYPATLAAGWWIGLSRTGLRSVDDNFFFGGLFGVIAAAACSWLAAWFIERARTVPPPQSGQRT